MKKALMMAVAATVLSMPAMAADNQTPETNHTAAQKTEKIAAKVDHKLMEADTNKDGKISKAEHQAAGDKMFDKADTNKDGNLTKEELVAAKTEHWGKMKNMKPSTGNE